MVGALADASGPAISVELTGLRGEQPAAMAGHLFRVAQEGITNALKHASAQHIWLLLHQETDSVTLRGGTMAWDLTGRRHLRMTVAADSMAWPNGSPRWKANWKSNHLQGRAPRSGSGSHSR